MRAVSILSMARSHARDAIGDVVELVKLLCMAILLGATIRTRFWDKSRCQSLRMWRSAREGICFAVLVSQE